MFFAYTFTNTVKLGAYSRARDPDILIHNGKEFNNYLKGFFFNCDAEQSKMLKISLRNQILMDFFNIKIQVR